MHMGSHRDGAWFIALCASAHLLLLGMSTARAAGGPHAIEAQVLFGTVFEVLAEPAALNALHPPDEARSRIETLLRRAERFRSRLPDDGGPPGPERAVLEKKWALERDLVALIDLEGIEEMAAGYARRAVLSYEWEGGSDGPLAEAAFAERYLADHPTTPLRPYLTLFLAHRMRCAYETETLNRGARAGLRDSLSERYGSYLAAALRDPDSLVRYVAADMDARPYLYLNADRPHRANQPPAEGTSDPPCSDAGLPDAIRDPRAWALKCFALSAGDEAARPESLTETRADIDGDGEDELLIGSAVDRGNAGGTHYVFRRDGPAFRYLGSLFLHPSAFKVLEPAEGGGARLLRYRRLGAGEGLLETVTYRGGAFTVTQSEKVFPQGADRSKFCGLFPALCLENAEMETAGGGPPLSLERALETAQAYAKTGGIDTSGQYVNSVSLQYDEDAKSLYWLVQWMWSKPRMGGELGVRVYMDGQVVLARVGP
jgi:hypothetical protein